MKLALAHSKLRDEQEAAEAIVELVEQVTPVNIAEVSEFKLKEAKKRYRRTVKANEARIEQIKKDAPGWETPAYEFY